MIHTHIHDNLGISIGNFLIPYYGLMIILGLFAAFLVGYYQIKKYNLSIDYFIFYFKKFFRSAFFCKKRKIRLRILEKY